MMEAIRAFVKRPTTIVGVATALMFQLIFGVIWMTAYDGVSENLHQFRIALVNLDQGTGREVAGNLSRQVPFEVILSDSLKEAQALLESRQVQMIVSIPEDFTRRLQSPETKATIRYFVNESNPAMVKSVMQGVASSMTEQVNKQAIAKGLEMTFQQVELPSTEREKLAANLSERVTGSIEAVHPVGSFSMQMVPMMMVLASYVGSMIMCLNIQQSAAVLGGTVGKWQQFSARLVINFAAALLVGLVGTTLVSLLGDRPDTGFVAIWLYLSLIIWTFLSVAQIFLLWFGPAGMLFNIIVLSIQLVTSGAMVPRELLSGFYAAISEYLPATYAVEGLMNLLFGGPDVLNDVGTLGVISFVAVAIGASAVAVKRPGIAAKPKGAQAHGQAAT
ncbi:YhgE/Pip domain-containing protein [Brevibacillus sp. H7]|uniref:YhgE/Pip domain-containing protein n=1 Tax=Brevibacillus sp. H7 TaxID=3349138 RepID=UPI0037F7C73F